MCLCLKKQKMNKRIKFVGNRVEQRKSMEETQGGVTIHCVYMCVFLNTYVFSSHHFAKVLLSLEINIINRDGNKYTFKTNRKNMKLTVYPLDNITTCQNKITYSK